MGGNEGNSIDRKTQLLIVGFICWKISLGRLELQREYWHQYNLYHRRQYYTFVKSNILGGVLFGILFDEKNFVEKLKCSIF